MISRRERHRKNAVFSNLFKPIVILYILIFIITAMTGGTNASFNDLENVNVSFKYGEEVWDKSSLSFENKFGLICQKPSLVLFTDIKNVGSTMQGTTKFELQFDPTQTPTRKKPGTTVFSGEIPALSSNQTFTLKTPAGFDVKPGIYKFRAYQRPGHSGNQVIWGGEIRVTEKDINSCKTAN
ncbi:amyloid fiber anchoring/assembly protein TapA [Bacillus sp. FJAT-27225]|uniref:amyloid fiber anchoring/assembly protein TapA n=1 Tax=Bacillus sp. FJAT-27225 TaxID=1743144 RepID=UPI00080C2992|nr:amyloid fiber anchoring/assembly protein TapA [Bacillus sp. FJAT-27225]OCA90841.1 amyloid fiber anchoring/assembly protein TapA [Bacillus sp. FJAT-27225]